MQNGDPFRDRQIKWPINNLQGLEWHFYRIRTKLLLARLLVGVGLQQYCGSSPSSVAIDKHDKERR